MGKVFWGEGLFLRPQHFQQQDAYHEARLRQTAASLHPYAWGLRNCRIDVLSLPSGTVRLLDVAAIFPDGEQYAAPQADELPEALSLNELADGTQATTIYLALPLLRPHGGNCGTDAKGSTRFVQTQRSTPDIYTDADEAELGFLCKTVRLLTEDEPRDAFSTVPVARIRRTSTGGFELDDEFIPPLVSLSASPTLLLHVRRLLDALQAKTDALFGTHREVSQHIVEFRSGDIASFWLLHTANAAFASLSHLYRHPGLSPERLFQELARVAGGLMTFSKAYTLADLPTYQHTTPQTGFETLFRMIRELLDTVISERYFSIALTEVKPSFHLGRIDSQRIDAHSAFYLGVAADLPGPELVQSVPTRFKVGAPDDVDKFVLSALPGVKLTHAAQVPAAIPVRPGSHYFAIEPRGPLYERMLKAESITIYVPSGIRELKLELIALTQ
ncbi:MAG: type VI secretion system baseplate subunit TssK [Xanthomonadaceae bacterium]|nr:type VI secretion system baseplate subunit TssK [Xanthomonadaceae bacterium]